MAKPKLLRKGAARRESAAARSSARKTTSSPGKGPQHGRRSTAKSAAGLRASRPPSKGRAPARKVLLPGTQQQTAAARRPRISGAVKTAPAAAPPALKGPKTVLQKGAVAGAKPDTAAPARLEEVKALIALGKKKGYLTYDEIMS
ncbi:MAG: RNA polymerase sigma factor region1.1 domain-containing protein, partial [candidate division NC10 bacterium]|nr:RNA polymerase sigma factor region1.1 domain-containing protein [candidate division NC10 bacterium]